MRFEVRRFILISALEIPYIIGNAASIKDTPTAEGFLKAIVAELFYALLPHLFIEAILMNHPTPSHHPAIRCLAPS
jgi:hypothetical protein